MKRVLTMAALLLVVSARFLSAQVQTPIRVTPFGGAQDSLPAMAVPPDLQPFIPAGFTLRAVMTTKMAPDGEKVFLYDNGEDIFPEVHLYALRDGKESPLFDDMISATGGLFAVNLSDGRQLLAFAYHSGGDLADTSLALYGFDGEGYYLIFRRLAMEGRMRILSTSPLRFEIWSADVSLDKEDENCVWCPHRYRVITYQLKGDIFELMAMRTTPKSPTRLHLSHSL